MIVSHAVPVSFESLQVSFHWFGRCWVGFVRVCEFSICCMYRFAVSSIRTFSVVSLSSDRPNLSWCPFTCLYFHVIREFFLVVHVLWRG